jgi:hypothetical protein
MFSTDTRVGRESPLYLSKSLGRNGKFRYTTNHLSQETPRETRREDPELVTLRSKSRASDPAISRSSTEVLGPSDSIAERQRQPEDPGKSESTLYVSSISQSTCLRCFTDTVQSPSLQLKHPGNRMSLLMKGNGKVQGMMSRPRAYINNHPDYTN